MRHVLYIQEGDEVTIRLGTQPRHTFPFKHCRVCVPSKGRYMYRLLNFQYGHNRKLPVLYPAR